MNGIIFCVRSASAISVLPIVLKRCQKERKKMQGEEGVTAKSKPIMNLVSRCSVRNPNVLASTASESPEKTNSESQKVPLSSLNEQQPRTGRLVKGASSSNYSEWNIDDTWSSQEWKSGEMLGARMERPVDDKSVIDHDVDSDTVTESNLSLKSRSFLRRVNDRVRNILDHSSKDAMQDIDKRSLICMNVSVFNIESICIHGKELLRKSTFHQTYTGTISRWNRCSTCLKSWSSDNQMRFMEWIQLAGKILSWKLLSLVSDEEVISLSHAKVYVFSDSVLCLGKMNQNPASKSAWEEKLSWFKSSSQYRTLDTIWWWADGIRVENFLRTHHIAARATKSKSSCLKRATQRSSPSTTYLHVDVQRHHMENCRQWTGMYC